MATRNSRYPITRAALLRAAAGAAAGTALGSVLTVCGIGTSEAPTPSRRPVSLLVDYVSPEEPIINPWIKRIKAGYAEYTVEFRNANPSDKAIALFAADSEGDVFELDVPLLPLFVPKGRFEDIGSTLAQLKFDTNALLEVETSTHNGKARIGLPVYMSSSAWVYNKTWFKQKGVAEPTAKWTWDDQLAAARTLSDYSNGKWGMLHNDSNFPFTWLRQAGVPYLSPDGLKTTFNTAPVRAVLQWVVDLVQRYHASPSPVENSAAKPAFPTGGLAMAPMQTPSKPLNTQIGGQFDWDVMPTPKHPTSGKPASMPLDCRGILVTKRASARGVLRESVQVAVEMLNKDIQELYFKTGMNRMSPVKTVAMSPEAMTPPPANYKIVIDNIASGRQASEAVVGWQGVRPAILPELNKAVNGEASVAAAAENMDRVGTAVLANAPR